MIPELKIQSTYDLVRELYRDDDGNPILLSPSQVEIFDEIFYKRHERVQVMTYSQFGKSLTTALAVLTRIATFPDKFVIIAPQEDKARIIMGYIIQHAFDNPYTKSKLELDKDETMDRLRRERSKKKLTFKLSKGRFGEVMVLSSDERNKRDAGNTLMGYGAPNIILDEAALIGDDVHAKVLRMLGGHVTKKTFFMKIGNPFRRNHFLRTSTDENYHHIVVDHIRGIKEGRLTESYIEEMKKEGLFSILYACEFPADDDVDSSGWMRLLTDAEIEGAQQESPVMGESKLGVDVADGGADLSVIVRRNNFAAEIVFANKGLQAMALCPHIESKMSTCQAEDSDVTIDKTGVGTATCQKMRELGHRTIAFIAGESALDYKRFHNRRAECYWRLREWMKMGGILKKDKRWDELKNIKYRFDELGKIQIMSKDKMRSEGIKSPNYCDALMLSFFKKDKVVTEEQNKEALLKSMGGSMIQSHSSKKLSIKSTSY